MCVRVCRLMCVWLQLIRDGWIDRQPDQHTSEGSAGFFRGCEQKCWVCVVVVVIILTGN